MKRIIGILLCCAMIALAVYELANSPAEYSGPCAIGALGLLGLIHLATLKTERIVGELKGISEEGDFVTIDTNDRMMRCLRAAIEPDVHRHLIGRQVVAKSRKSLLYPSTVFEIRLNKEVES